MASNRKKQQPGVGKVAEFFSALRGFWPVWLAVSLIVLAGGVYTQVDYGQIKQLVTDWTSSSDENANPIRRVKLTGEIYYLTKEDIQQAVVKKIESGYLSNEIVDVRVSVENLPWVEQAKVKRISLDTVEVFVIERRPLVRWKKQGLISQKGELFFPENIKQFSSLPVLHCPEKLIESSMAMLEKIVPSLSSLQIVLTELKLDSLGSWLLTTNEGIKVQFGRKNMSNKIEVLLKAYPEILARGKPENIDLRYANGAAVRFEQNG